MSGANSFGNFFRVTTFGESHGSALGVVIDGCPAGVSFDHDLLVKELSRRRPGQSAVVSARAESDQSEVLSGVFEQKTLGTPICILVRNHDAKSEDYDAIKKNPRAGHADDMWLKKFGHVDHRGGGRASGRETVARVMAGAVAQMLVRALSPATTVVGFSQKIGPFELDSHELAQITSTDAVDGCVARFPGRQQSELEALLLQAKEDGKSYGGTAGLWVLNPPVGLGQPVFHKLKSDWASALMGVGATTGLEWGAGQAATDQEGSQFHAQAESPYGGIRGGISTGETLVVRCFFKPTSSVLEVAKKGRHDPCIVPRAIPVLEAMTWLVLADHLLWQHLDRLN
jgi:chorismate synthase